MHAQQLDDFHDVSSWLPVASGQAKLALTREPSPAGHALRFEYDFHSSGGFVVARKTFSRSIPTSWALTCRVRGAAPANKLEIKLADPSNKNVWWWHRDAFAFPSEWETLRIRSSEVEFAWGPAGGGSLRELGALEIAIAAGPGGIGSVWIEDLRFEDLELREPPAVRASSAAPGHGPEHVLDGASPTSWRSEPGAAPQWLAFDFRGEHEYGGLVIDWAEGGAARAFDVERSDDGNAWEMLWSARQAEGSRTYVYLAGGARSHRVRLVLHEPCAGEVFEIRRVDVRPFDFSRSLNDFFHAVAANEPRGHHPKWLHREQTYWSPVNVEGGTMAAILNEEGMLEPDRASFSLEPFLHADGGLVSWADAEISLTLAQGSLPIPASVWDHGDLRLTTTAFVADGGAGAAARCHYRVENRGAAPKSVRLFVAIRPFQVNPPWQAFQGMGGTAAIHELAWRSGAVLVDGRKLVVPLTPPLGFGASAFEQGGAMRFVAEGELPPRAEVTDAFGHASGALRWDLELAPGSAQEIEIAVPFGEIRAAETIARAAKSVSLASTMRHWEEKLGRVRIDLGGGPGDAIDTLRTATGHILVNRDGAGLQPGPRRYTRSWIRDGATMAAALLRMGCNSEVRDFIRWYAPYQRADGNVPCAVDRNGADWLPEHDSHGQLVFNLAEYFRFTGDLDLVKELWPAALKAIDYLEVLRATRLTAEFRTPERKGCFGILPESASHEGYLAHPVHAYWDDFWALRGIGDAVDLARALGDDAQAERLAALRDSFHECLYASIEETIVARGLSYIPGSVEWADFDPTATSTAISTTDAAQRLPAAALAWSYDEYLRGLAKRRNHEIDWNNYTAYEIRTLGALARLGRRAEALDLLDFFLADRRPRPWNQWPEISWRNPKSPGHLGDVPHSWIGAEFVLAMLGMLAYERPADGALVLAAGVSEAWLEGGDVTVEGLATWWGPLGYRLSRTGPRTLRLDLAAGLRPPPGGIVIEPPLPSSLISVDVDGRPSTAFDSRTVTIPASPASVVMRF